MSSESEPRGVRTPRSFIRLILPGVPHSVSPLVIRVLAVPDSLTLTWVDEIFCAIVVYQRKELH